MITVQAYLIGLGLTRLTTQMDPATQSVWDGYDMLHLLRDGDITQERDYLLHRWCPTPVTHPWWNGFAKGDDYLEAIAGSSTERLADYRAAVSVGQRVQGVALKGEQLRAYRNAAPESALDWIDAIVVERADGELLYHFAVGTGGNDGRLDFSRSFMRAICAVMDLRTGEPTKHSATWLNGLLGLIEGTQPESDIPGGQFFNGETVNPWALILALEGCTVFAAGAWRHQVTPALGWWPNSGRLCRAALRAAPPDEVVGQEFWWPVWRRPLSYPALRELLSTQQLMAHGKRIPEDGLSYVIAAGTDQRNWLGEVLRVSRMERNGQAHFLTAEGLY